MKLLFIADIHIKLGAKNVPIDWAKNRYNMLWSKIQDLSDGVDAVIVGGDIFDKAPSLEELDVYFNFVQNCTRPTFIYSGNHEAIKKNTTFLSFLAKTTNRLNSLVDIVDTYTYQCLPGVDILPYNCLKDFVANGVKESSGNILCTHVRGEIPPHVKPEVDLELFKDWKVVLAGDLHSHENSQRNILYPGSPVTTSFHREKTSNGVIIIDTVTLEHEFIDLELPLLLKKTVKAGEPLIPTEYHHTIYEVEGDMAELSTIKDTELLSKKVTKKIVDTALVLDSDMTLEQELTEYLLYILSLDEQTVKNTVKVFKDSFKQ